MFYYARAATYDGPGALPPAGRTQIDAFVTRAYKGFHGDLKGLDELKALAKTNATPPAGFTIKSVTEIAKENVEKENAAAAADPTGAMWKRVKEELTGPTGASYFDSSMKDADFPELRGKVVSQTPALKPKEITVAMGDSTDAEITLKLAEGTMPGKAEPGTEIHFKAIPKSYTASPLMVVMEVEKPSNIKGWPAAAPRPARPRPGAAKKK